MKRQLEQIWGKSSDLNLKSVSLLWFFFKEPCQLWHQLCRSEPPKLSMKFVQTRIYSREEKVFLDGEQLPSTFSVPFKICQELLCYEQKLRSMRHLTPPSPQTENFRNKSVTIREYMLADIKKQANPKKYMCLQGRKARKYSL